MTHNTATETKAANPPAMIPIRCSVCGKPFLNLYKNTMPGMIFATCRSGHKTSYRVSELSRKAV